MALLPIAARLAALLPFARRATSADAVQFFLYDTPKVLLLLAGVVFVMGMVDSYFTPERTRALLAGRGEGVGNVLAASARRRHAVLLVLGGAAVHGFVQAGVPLGITFSFLISAPMVNEVALVLLLGLFGWKIAAIYLGLGLAVAIVSGWVIGRLKMESLARRLGARHGTV